MRPGVALARATATGLDALAAEPIELERPQEDDLLPAIDRACRRVGIGPRDLRGVAVSAGPGGFTALRIATAAGKMIAEATGAACWGVPTAIAAALRAEASGPFAVALASKGDTAWVTPFDSARRATGPGRLWSVRDLNEAGIRSLVADQFLPEPIRAECARLGIEVRPPVFDATAVIEAAAGLEAIDPVALVPLYPREPEAVTKWRERKSR